MVLTSSMVIVMGPTPPGTGVMKPATSLTPSKSTSPQSLPSSLRFMPTSMRSEEHTSELQSQSNLVCRLLLEKKNTLNPQAELARFPEYGLHIARDWTLH